ncbi:MAG: phosphatase PAP2 family protein [Clostridia bacterium]|nr:phosphatase PAP2 family protein [Clostridia bacterium]
MTDAIYRFDYAILDYIAEHWRCGFLDAVMPVISEFAHSGIGWIAVALLLICFKKTRKTGLMCAAALTTGLILCNFGLKPLVARIRPYENTAIHEAIALIVPPEKDFSFPSGHTIASFEVAAVLMIRDRKRFGWASLVLAVLIAFSRLYLYVHYPTDVIAAVILGIAIGFFAVWVVNALDQKIRAKRGLADAE